MPLENRSRVDTRVQEQVERHFDSPGLNPPPSASSASSRRDHRSAKQTRHVTAKVNQMAEKNWAKTVNAQYARAREKELDAPHQRWASRYSSIDNAETRWKMLNRRGRRESAVKTTPDNQEKDDELIGYLKLSDDDDDCCALFCHCNQMSLPKEVCLWRSLPTKE